MKELANISTNDVSQHLMNTLKNSLYPKAKDNSIAMVLDYCKSANLDPMQKPVHIVPMWDKDSRTMKDTIMPGIGLYRIQAARSNKYAGVSEPEYGDTVNTKLGGVNISYPEWCKVTVKKLVGDNIVEFTAKEYWLENYATVKRDSAAPNTMWTKRPFGQLAKCAEAQALRKAFPEIITQQPTAEEMEGKFIEEKDVTPQTEVQKQDLSAKLDNVLLEQAESSEEVEQAKVQLIESEEENVSLNELIFTHNIPSETIDKWCTKFGIDKIEDLPEEKKQNCIDYIKKEYQQVVTLEEIEEENAGYTYK